MRNIKEHLNKPVTYKAVVFTYIAFVISIFLGAYAIGQLGATSRHADIEIFKSRIGSVRATCDAQNTQTRKPLARLILVSLSQPNDPRYSQIRQNEFRIKFVKELRNLQPWDCNTQQLLLYEALKAPNFDRSVPYCISYKKWKVNSRKCPQPPDLPKKLKHALLTGTVKSTPMR